VHWGMRGMAGWGERVREGWEGGMGGREGRRGGVIRTLSTKQRTDGLQLLHGLTELHLLVLVVVELLCSLLCLWVVCWGRG